MARCIPDKAVIVNGVDTGSWLGLRDLVETTVCTVHVLLETLDAKFCDELAPNEIEHVQRWLDCGRKPGDRIDLDFIDDEGTYTGAVIILT